MFAAICKKQFKAMHSVKNPDGSFEKPHKHNFKVECKVISESLDENGFVADFRLIDDCLNQVVALLINSNLNNIEKLKSPSAENIAFYIYSELTTLLKTDSFKLKKIKVWEDENHGASYKE